MTFITTFNAFGKDYTLKLKTEDIVREYDDEAFAYWVAEIDGHWFEVNIWKDEKGNYTNEGKVYGFVDSGKMEDAGEPDEQTEIIFIPISE